MLHFVFTAFASQLCDADTGCVIYNQIGITNHITAFNQFFPFLVGQITGSDMLGIHMGL